MYISKSMYQVFCEKWNNGEFAGQRFGQAFFNHFNLHKMTMASRAPFDKIYNLPDNEAKPAIAPFIDHEN